MNNSLTEVHPELVSEWSEKKAKAGRSPAPPRPKTFDYRKKTRIMKKSYYATARDELEKNKDSMNELEWIGKKL